MFFSYNPNYASVCDVIFDLFKIKQDQIIGFQQLRSDKYVIKFTNTIFFEEFCDKYEEKIVGVSGEGNVRIVNLSKVFTYVSIRYAPFDMEDETLRNILSRYGKVHDMRWNKFSYGKAKDLFNGTRTAHMQIKSNIPSSVNVQGHRIFFIYNGQKRTCHKCGEENHLAANCEVENAERVNVFDEKEFPHMSSSDNSPPKENDEAEGNVSTPTETNQPSETIENPLNGETEQQDTLPGDTGVERNEELIEENNRGDYGNLEEIFKNPMTNENGNASETTGIIEGEKEMKQFVVKADIHVGNNNENNDTTVIDNRMGEEVDSGEGGVVNSIDTSKTVNDEIQSKETVTIDSQEQLDLVMDTDSDNSTETKEQGLENKEKKSKQRNKKPKGSRIKQVGSDDENREGKQVKKQKKN